MGSALSFEVRGVRQDLTYFSSFYLYSVRTGNPAGPAGPPRGRGSPASRTAGGGSRRASFLHSGGSTPTCPWSTPACAASSTKSNATTLDPLRPPACSAGTRKSHDELRKGHHRRRRHHGFTGDVADGLPRQARHRVRRHPRGLERGKAFRPQRTRTTSWFAIRGATKDQIEDTFARLHLHRATCPAAVRGADLISESVPEAPGHQGGVLTRGIPGMPPRGPCSRRTPPPWRRARWWGSSTGPDLPGPALRHRRVGRQHRRGHGPPRHRPRRLRAVLVFAEEIGLVAIPLRNAVRLHRQQPPRALVHVGARPAGARCERVPRASTAPG